jgi:hypothetical protein
LIHESQEKNDRFQERFGLHARWNWDDERSTLTFSDPEKVALEIDVSIVGSTEGNSWEWAWANANIPLRRQPQIPAGESPISPHPSAKANELHSG